MQIVHVSRFDVGDGAANAAYRLHRGLLQLGHQSSMFVAETRSEIQDPTVKLFQPPADPLSRIRRRLRHEAIARSFARYRESRPPVYEFFSDDRSPHGGDFLNQLPSADVINVHSMYQFVDYRAFFSRVPQQTPVVRTLHDMNFFTGGCHLDGTCGRYSEHCHACPQLGSRDAKDLSYQIWQRKNAALKSVRGDRLQIVTPSKWLADEARRSTILRNFTVSVIPHGLDIDVFRPRDRAFARDVLGIPQDAQVVLFVAEPTNRPIKGFTVLAGALEGLKDRAGLFLLSAGGGKLPAQVAIPHLHLGQIKSGRLLSTVYSAADVFVIPSLQENFPLTALEALACGTPVIGSAIGGIQEIVQPEVTGLLFPVRNVTALQNTIAELLGNPERRAEMSSNCRRIATEEYSLEVQTRRYLALYQNMLTGN